MLDDVKLLLGIKDDMQDNLLKLIIKQTKQQLQNRLMTDEVPGSFEYVINEVAVTRFNRIGSEAASSESLNGYSQKFTNDDFSRYDKEIQSYLNEGQANSVKFL